MTSKARKTNAEPAGASRQTLLLNYARSCRNMGVQPNARINEIIRGKDDTGELAHIVLDEDIGPLGSSGLRALAHAILGAGSQSSAGAYIHLTSIRLCNLRIGDEGANIVASIISSPFMAVAHVEILDCNITQTGCAALGKAIAGRETTKLNTLCINYNAVADSGVEALCQNLFISPFLKELHLDYCKISAEGCHPLAQLLAMHYSALENLSIQGNDIQNEGLFRLSLGIARSRKLTMLNLADNGILSDPKSLTAFVNAILRCQTLAHIDFTYNKIEAEGATIFLTSFESLGPRLQVFLADSSIPTELLKKLHRPIKDSKTKKRIVKSKAKK